MDNHWQDTLPRPLAFALSGGSSLGAIQVGMLQALTDIGLEPDLVVGTSVGALNGAAIAEHGLTKGTALLTELWKRLRRQDIFPGGLPSQIGQLIRTRLSLFSQKGLRSVIQQIISIERIEQLSIPFGALATELPSYRGNLFTEGDLLTALLASSAIPGIYRPVQIKGNNYIDGGLVANVPLKAAVDMGARSIVVLDAGNTCLSPPPRHLADVLLGTLNSVWHQRAIAEAPLIANICPIIYISSPCPVSRTPFNFAGTSELIEIAAQTAKTFLEHCPTPKPGSMCGGPHYHQEVVLQSTEQSSGTSQLNLERSRQSLWDSTENENGLFHRTNC